MDGPLPASLMAVLTYGRVIGYDVINHGILVTLPSMQQAGVTCKVLINGPADAFRVEQNPLPIMGTWGLIAIPHGDPKSAIWLGSFYQSMVNAVTCSNPPANEDSQIKYMSHNSGAYAILDNKGNYFYQAPDKTQLLINSNNAEPTTYRQYAYTDTTASIPRQTQVQVNYDDRVPNPPSSSFYAALKHPSGASITVTPSGEVDIVAGKPAQASATITPSGVITIQTGSSQSTGVGPIVLLDPVNQNVYIKGQGDKGQIQIDQNGNITIISARQINIEADGGDIYLNTNTHTDSVNRIINFVNSHIHSGVQSGSNDSGPPTTTIP